MMVSRREGVRRDVIAAGELVGVGGLEVVMGMDAVAGEGDWGDSACR